MKSNTSLLYNCFLVIGDFLSLLLAFVAAYILRVSLDHQALTHPVFARTYLAAFLLLLPFWIIIFALIGLYNSNVFENRFSEAARLFVGSLFGILFVIGYSYAFNQIIFPAHLVALYGLMLAFVLLLIFRNLARYTRSLLFSYGIGITNVLIVGNTNTTHELVETLHNSRESGYKIIGVVGPSGHNNEAFKSIPLFSSFNVAWEKLGEETIHSIVQTELYSDEPKNNQILSYAQANHISYRFIPGNTELFVGNIEVELFRASIPVIAVHQTPLIGWGRIVKRLFDIFISALVLIVLSPVLLIISILIFVFDPGSIIFKQDRVTRFNGHFKIYKFRTMHRKQSGRDPETVFKELDRQDLIENYHETGQVTQKNDPRINFFGRFLRKFSLDELPQLINVLTGDISLVGPRAITSEELKFYKDKLPLLLSVKTGMSGLAQVSGRSNLDYQERARLDLYYVQNWSFWLDIIILFKTVRVVIRRTGVR
jgi:exopolysaccharide biosynthesis polyprenyl glycosylphosphotransferase